MNKEMFIDVLPEGMAGEIIVCHNCRRVGFQRYRICYDHSYAHRYADESAQRHPGYHGLAEALRQMARDGSDGFTYRFTEADLYCLRTAADLLDGDR